MAAARRRRSWLGRLGLLGPAWRLHRAAQSLTSGESLPAVRERLLAVRGLPRDVDPQDALWAAAWAARLQRRLLGRLDTCLVRSLTAAALIADESSVSVRIGVQKTHAGTDLMDSHAWLAVDDRAIEPIAAAEGFEEVLALPMERAT